jgi:hypothetical protein
MKRAHHLLFSPDLAPPVFYLFGEVKTALMSAEFERNHDPLNGVMGVLSVIPRDELQAVSFIRLSATPWPCAEGRK